jgi:predicted GIY-YIG superfamily endonuclease
MTTAKVSGKRQLRSPTTLYRLYNSQDRLLYIGIAGNPGRRFQQHRGDKPWWGEVSRTELEHYADRDQAAAAELEAIRDEKPLYNVVGAPREVRTLTFIVRCSICQEPIDDGAGYVECDAGAASEAYSRYTEKKRDRLRRELEGGPPAERYIGNEILDLLEDDIPWRAFHQSCDPDPHAGTYWVDVESIRTWQDVLKWTLHLNEKAWVQHTNWDAILRRLIAKGEIAP